MSARSFVLKRCSDENINTTVDNLNVIHRYKKPLPKQRFLGQITYCNNKLLIRLT